MNKFERERRELVSEICKKLGLSEKVKKSALKLLNKAEKKLDFSGLRPYGVCATIVYLTIKKHKNIGKYKFCADVDISTAALNNYLDRFGDLE